MPQQFLTTIHSDCFSSFQTSAVGDNDNDWNFKRLINRCIVDDDLQVHVDDIPGPEWEVILAERCGLPPSHCKLLVKVLHELQVYWKMCFRRSECAESTHVILFAVVKVLLHLYSCLADLGFVFFRCWCRLNGRAADCSSASMALFRPATYCGGPGVSHRGSSSWPKKGEVVRQTFFCVLLCPLSIGYHCVGAGCKPCRGFYFCRRFLSPVVFFLNVGFLN